jgi:hypothetical protein
MIINFNAMIVSWGKPDGARGDGSRTYTDAWDPLIEHRWVQCQIDDPSWEDRQSPVMRDAERGRTLLTYAGVLLARGVTEPAIGDRVRVRMLDRAGKPTGEQLTYVVAKKLGHGATGAAGGVDLLKVMLIPG